MSDNPHESSFTYWKILFRGPGIKFLLVGGVLTLLDLVLFQLFANVLRISVLGMPPNIVAVWIGTPIVVLLNFFISHRWVWHSTVKMSQTIVPFFGLNLFSGIVVQSLVIHFTVPFLNSFHWLSTHSSFTNFGAKCLAVFIGMIINFFGAKILFKWEY